MTLQKLFERSAKEWRPATYKREHRSRFARIALFFLSETQSTPRKRYASDVLRSLGLRLRSHQRRHAADLVAIGRLINSARPHLRGRSWCEWFESLDASYSLRVAHQCVRAWRLLGNVEPSILKRWAPSVARLLIAQRVAARPEICERLKELGRDRRVRWADARAAISDVDPQAIYTAIRPVEESPNEVLGRRLLGLICDPVVSVVSFDVAHATAEDEDSIVSLRLWRGGKVETFTSRSLALVLADATGERQKRFCKRCPDGGAWLPEEMFSKSCHYCKRCERARVAKHERDKKAKKQGV